MTTEALDLAIDRGDLDNILREVESLCDDRAWQALLRARDRCRMGHERGHQLWPAAVYIAHRVALDAPGEFAAQVLEHELGAFGLGPLTEVIAQKHEWSELAAHIADPHLALTVAQERCIRGENLADTTIADSPHLDIPLWLPTWETPPPNVTYKSWEVAADGPALLRPSAEFAADTSPPTDVKSESGDECTDALLELTTPWVAHSESRRRVVAVDGDIESAIRACDQGESAYEYEVMSPGAALSFLGWVGSVTGGRGRRRGRAAGRTAAWWTAATFAGLEEEWPLVTPAALAELELAMSELTWARWRPQHAAPDGWTVRLAVADPLDGLAWALELTEIAD